MESTDAEGDGVTGVQGKESSTTVALGIFLTSTVWVQLCCKFVILLVKKRINNKLYIKTRY